MSEMKFEKDLINEVVVKWVGSHSMDPECRKVLDTHERAIRLKTPEAIESYHLALRELWIIRPWDCGVLGFDVEGKKSVLVR